MEAPRNVHMRHETLVFGGCYMLATCKKVMAGRQFRISLATCFMLAIVPVSCKRRNKTPASALSVADPDAARQLLWGFYEVSEHAWRWTAPQFAVAVRPPEGSDSKGASIRLGLYFPEDELTQVGPMTLSARTDCYELDSITFQKPGLQEYRSKVPAKLLNTNILPIIFSFDKALPPSATDSRELGVVIRSVELRTD
jgi:hypothetical protein